MSNTPPTSHASTSNSDNANRFNSHDPKDLGYSKYHKMVEQNMPYSICLEREFEMPTPTLPEPVKEGKRT